MQFHRFVALGCIVVSGAALAQQQPTSRLPAQMQPASQSDKDKKSDSDSQNLVGKLKAGGGLGVVIDLKGNRVNDADLVNGIVRVNSDSNITVRPLGEVHVFAWTGDHGKLAWGPFVAAQFGTSDIVDSVGAGLMVGTRLDANANKDNTLNFGVGLAVDPGVKGLGNGIKEDQPLPAGETQIRFRTSTHVGLMLVTSYGF